MNMGMQVSFSETFNIVAADFVANNVPVVVSPEITWVNSIFHANPTDAYNIAGALQTTWVAAKLRLQYLNKIGLASFNRQAISTWLHFLGIW